MCVDYQRRGESMKPTGPTLAEQIAEKACDEYYDVGWKERTGEHLQTVVKHAIREYSQRVAEKICTLDECSGALNAAARLLLREAGIEEKSNG